MPAAEPIVVVTCGVGGDRSMIETLLSPLFTTAAKFRRLSTATPVGLLPTAMGEPIRAGGVAVRSIKLTLLVPLLATTATPVAVLMATAAGTVHAVGGV